MFEPIRCFALRLAARAVCPRESCTPFLRSRYRLLTLPSRSFTSQPSRKMELGKYSVAIDLDMIQHPAVSKNLEHRMFIIGKEGLYGTARLIKAGSTAWREQQQNLEILKPITQEPELGTHIVKPTEVFEVTNSDGEFHCLIYDEILGPNMDYMTEIGGPEEGRLPAKLIHKFASETLQALVFLHSHNIPAGLAWDTMRYTYPQLDRTDLKSIQSFFGGSDEPSFNDTATGPESAPADVGAVKFKLDGLRGIESLHFSDPLDSPRMNMVLENPLLNQFSPAIDIFALGKLLTDLTAGAPEFTTIIGGNGDTALSRLLDSRRLLGELPANVLEKLPADQRTPVSDYHLDALYNVFKQAYKQNPLDESMRFTEQEIVLLTELVKKMMAYDPSERISARDALGHDFFHQSS